jgi:hypothetical protein
MTPNRAALQSFVTRVDKIWQANGEENYAKRKARAVLPWLRPLYTRRYFVVKKLAY